MAEYVNTSNHPQQVASGAFVPAFSPTGKVPVDPKDDHDAALIADGTLIERPAKRKSEDN